MQLSHRFAVESAVFDARNLASLAGLVPVMGLAKQTGLGELLAAKVAITSPRIKSRAANPGLKLATQIAGMCAGADSIDDIDVLRSGGMGTVFDQVYAPSTGRNLVAEVHFRACPAARIAFSGWSAFCAQWAALPFKPTTAPTGSAWALTKTSSHSCPRLLTDGIDPDPILATHPTTVDTNPAAITAFVCAMSGYWARNSRLPAPPRSPNLRVHQAEKARVSRAWLTKRITMPGR